jgi:hypothetical protein
MNKTRKAFAAVVMSAALLGPISLATSTPANAAPIDCVGIGKALFAAKGGNLPATIAGLRSVSGCGSSAAGAICAGSRQWWGGFFQWIVRQITGGRYSTC